MSRSYKKFPIRTDRDRSGSARWFKNYANRVLRRKLNSDYDLVLNHKLYKKNYETWEIRDWIDIPGYDETELEYRWNNDLIRFPKDTLEEQIWQYRKWYKRK